MPVENTVNYVIKTVNMLILLSIQVLNKIASERII
jgi:hypothetical protein